MRNIYKLVVLSILTTFSLQLASQDFEQNTSVSSLKLKDWVRKPGEKVLIVRLQNEDRRIAALRQKGREKVADKMQLMNQIEVDSLRSAFTTYFDYCPVYFYSSTDASKLFKDQDYSVLKKSDGSSANIESFSTPPLVCHYGSVPHLRWNNRKKLVLYEWEEFSRILYIKKAYFPKTSWIQRWRDIPVSEPVQFVNRALHTYAE